jgi:hypothetical protein
MVVNLSYQTIVVTLVPAARHINRSIKPQQLVELFLQTWVMLRKYTTQFINSEKIDSLI